VNEISFHPNGSFSTVGSDATYNFWDKDSRRRLHAFQPTIPPISCGNFSPDGTKFVYALSYEWSKGYVGQEQLKDNFLMLHIVKPGEVKRR